MFAIHKTRNTNLGLRLLFTGIVVIIGLHSLMGCGGGSSLQTARTGVSGQQSSPSPADTLTADQKTALKTNDTHRQQAETLIAEAEKHIERKPDGTLGFKEEDTRAAPISAEAREFAETALAETNRRIKAGEISADARLNITPADTTRAVNQTYVAWRWWGVTIALSNDNWQAFRAAWTISGTPGAIRYMAKVGLTGSWAAAFVPVIAAAWMWTIDYVNNSGGRRGVYVNITWATFIWVTPQS